MTKVRYKNGIGKCLLHDGAYFLMTTRRIRLIVKLWALMPDLVY